VGQALAEMALGTKLPIRLLPRNQVAPVTRHLCFAPFFLPSRPPCYILDPAVNPLALDLPMPDYGFIKAINQYEGFSSIGWRSSPAKVFN
jgi:hypothetical protein